MDERTVAVIGGGILGMRSAELLAERGFRPTILERSSSVGGLASPLQIGPYRWDRFYHVVLLSDLRLRRLLDRLGLSDQVRWGTTRTGFFTEGRLHSMSNAIEFLRFPPLSLVGKIRLASTILYASRLRDWQRLEEVPVTEWLTRLSGRRVFEQIWLPLLKSKLGDNYQLASAAFIWTTIQRMYAARRSGLKTEMFGYVDGGYESVLTRYAEHLKAMGVSIECGAGVAEVRSSNDGAMVCLEDGSPRSFDAAVLTVPAPVITAICPQLRTTERERLEGIVYQGIVCASLLLRRPLANFYVTNITDDWVPFTGVIEMTALVDPNAFCGHSLVYLPRYLAQEDPFWQCSDSDVRREFVTALDRMYPSFRPEDVLACEISRARYVLALPTLRYSQRWLPPVVTSLPNVFILNSSQIAAGTLNVNETLGVVESRRDELIAHLQASSPS